MPTDKLRSLIREEMNELVEIRHDLHRHPELGYEEERTSGVVVRELEKAGVECRGGLAGGTGVLGHLPGVADKATGLRADMDALPILEETGLDYASAHEGVMHACGHDGHTTGLIGAARVLARIAKEQTLPRPVAFIYQPAEEGGAGARRMIDDGCLDGSLLGPRLDHVFGLHGWPQYPLGVVGTRSGPMLAAADTFEITVIGTGGHAAMPHRCHDPIVAGSAIVGALQSIASRNVDPLDSIVVSTSQVSGGTAFNVIPNAMKLTGTVRTLLTSTQNLAVERVTGIAEQVAEAYGCRADVAYTKHYPVTCNDADAVAIFDAIATPALGADRVRTLEAPVMGAEDFSFYCQEIPSCFFVLGLLAAGLERMPGLHQPKFDFNDNALETGIELFCRLALR